MRGATPPAPGRPRLALLLEGWAYERQRRRCAWSGVPWSSRLRMPRPSPLQLARVGETARRAADALFAPKVSRLDVAALLVATVVLGGFVGAVIAYAHLGGKP